MGCEGGVTIYDANAIEQQFGEDVWERSGWGRQWCMPLVDVHGHKVLVTDWETCSYHHVDAFCEVEHGGYAYGLESTYLDLYIDEEKQEFAREVASWSVRNATIDSVETWT